MHLVDMIYHITITTEKIGNHGDQYIIQSTLNFRYSKLTLVTFQKKKGLCLMK